MKNLLVVFLVLFLSVPALAGEPGRFGLGINYCRVSNFKAWLSASTESGSMLRIDYTYDLNDFYTTAFEIAFFADDNVFKNAPVSTYVQTAAFFSINHIFHTGKLGPLSPYLKFGTGILGVNLLRKQDNTFYSTLSDVTADISAGMGVEFNLWKALVNVDLTLPGLFHVAYLNKDLVYVLGIGWKHYF